MNLSAKSVYLCKGKADEFMITARFFYLPDISTRDTRSICSAGYTITEMMIAVAIIGILSAVAVPSFFEQLLKARQNNARATISQLMTQATSYSDEFGQLAMNWKDLNKVAAVMTQSGPAVQDNFSSITLPSGHYTLSSSIPTHGYYEFTAKPVDNYAADYNVIGCIDLSNGASNIQAGSPGSAAKSSELTCKTKS